MENARSTRELLHHTVLDPPWSPLLDGKGHDMKEPVNMPRLSDTMETGKISAWSKRAGDPVNAGDIIGEIETDKALMDLESPRKGFLLSPLPPGDADIPVGTPIAYIGDSPTEDVSSSPPPRPASNQPKIATEPAPAMPHDTSPPSPPSAPKDTEGRMVRISPYARSLARDLGISEESLPQNPSGEIHARDVIGLITPRTPAPDLDKGPPYRIEKPSGIRKAVARRMEDASRTPVFRISANLSIEPLLRIAKLHSPSVSLALARCLAFAAREFPLFNAAWTNEGIAMRDRVDVGIAVDTGNGLITPVVRDMAARPYTELADEWKDLAVRARNQKLRTEEYQGATIYLSNLGEFSVVTAFDAILPLGATAILAVASPGPDGRSAMTLTCDHRVVFGADAARFLQSLSERFAQPEALFPRSG
jgi:pyruvate dehydrogenase E2 component (dihydrolipoamide acetyltransferase)